MRTADEAIDVARSDLKAMLGLLDLRHVAGDAALTGELRERSLEFWRREAPKRVAGDVRADPGALGGPR